MPLAYLADAERAVEDLALVVYGARTCSKTSTLTLDSGLTLKAVQMMREPTVEAELFPCLDFSGCAKPNSARTPRSSRSPTSPPVDGGAVAVTLAPLERVLLRLVKLEPMIARIDATLPHLATKAELTTGLSDLRTELIDRTSELGRQLADKPGRLYMWGVMAALTVAYTAALAAIGVLLTYLPGQSTHANLAPAGIVLAAEAFDWDHYHDRQDACRELSQAQMACAKYGLLTCGICMPVAPTVMLPAGGARLPSGSRAAAVVMASPGSGR